VHDDKVLRSMKRRVTCWTADQLPASQEGPCPKQLISRIISSGNSDYAVRKLFNAPPTSETLHIKIYTTINMQAVLFGAVTSSLTTTLERKGLNGKCSRKCLYRSISSEQNSSIKRQEMHTLFWCRSVLEDPKGDGMIILRWISRV